MELRPAIPDDFAAIAAIWSDRAHSMDGGAPRVDGLDLLMARLNSNLANGWNLEVAVVSGTIVGFLATFPEKRILDQLFVSPALQRKGIGAALLERAKEQLGDGFTLWTPVTNIAGHRFYERNGLCALRDGTHPRTGAPVRYFGWLR